ncbi:MAG: galactose mutarotase, partial [Bacteroidales bacterium]|nr:galactose mutarotase [Bacteroidales bacterium]
SIGGYLNTPSSLGAFIGRVGNRINQGKFSLDGVAYQLQTNKTGHCMHGGPKGFQFSMFDIHQISDQSLEVSYISADGEMGFPGTLMVQALYTLTDDNALDITYQAKTDKPTIINLTNHTFFNLSGNPEKDILGQILLINADAYTPIDSSCITTGEIAPVCSTPMDFRQPTKIGERIDHFDFIQLKNGKGYDHNWVLNTAGNDTVLASCLVDPESGRTLKVYTDAPGLQVYTGNALNGTLIGKKGITYQQRSAICLETQHYPDSPNKPDWPSVVLRPGEVYTSHCRYQFGIMDKDCLAKCKKDIKDCPGGQKTVETRHCCKDKIINATQK